MTRGGFIVVCRRRQLVEAAIALSCAPPGTEALLVVLDPPSATQGDYRSLFAAYRSAADDRDLTPSMAAIRSADSAGDALTPYRQWAKHARFVAELLASHEPSRALFLFEASVEDMTYLDPLARRRLSDEAQAIFPEDCERVTLVRASGFAAADVCEYTTLAGLSDAAWRVMRGGEPDLANAIALTDEPGAGIYAALYDALERGLALRPVCGGPALAAPVRRDPPGAAAQEAVMIEDAGDAERLLGVVYARRRQARLLVIPEPDGVPIEAARAAVERRNAPVPLVPGLTKKAIVAAVRASLLDDGGAAEMAALEQAVTAALPRAIFDEVGDLPLTALTTATPYHFAAHDGRSWAEKPIGHVAGDMSLLLLDELYGEAPHVQAGFDVLFDPGYIATVETSGVLSKLDGAASYPLLLAGPAGSSLALTWLAPTLPIELLFFNSHGSENGLMLADMPMPLPASKIVQRTTLRARPIVFNNSCLSWVGVGREFVRAGARGYIGTLWSVHEAQAAEFAKAAVGAMTSVDAPVASALRCAGAAGVDARAYIFIGTTATRLRRVKAASRNDAGDSTLPAALLILHSLDALVAENTGGSVATFSDALVDVLLRAAEALLVSVDTAGDVSADRVTGAVLQMRVYAALVDRDPAEAGRANAFFTRWIAALAKVPDERERLRAKAALLLAASRVPARIGPWREAVGALEKSIVYALRAGDVPIVHYLELCDSYRDGGDYASARRALGAAQDGYASARFAPDIALLACQSRLAASCGVTDVAIERAQSAEKLAQRGDDLRALANVRTDLANAFLAAGRSGDALTAAESAYRFSALAYDDDLRLRANEIRVAATLAVGGAASAALGKASDGLALAKRRGWPFAIAAQTEAYADSAAATGDDPSAFVRWCAAGWLYLQASRPMRVTCVLEKVRRAASASGSRGAIVQYLRLSLGVVDDFEPPLRAVVVGEYTAVLAALVAQPRDDSAQADFTYLANEARGILDARGNAASNALKAMTAQALEASSAAF